MHHERPRTYEEANLTWLPQPETFLPPSDHETVLCSVKDRIAILTLNRPERLNNITTQMKHEFGDLLRRCDADDSVGALVITGAGRAFCAGGEMDAANPASFQGGSRPDAKSEPIWTSPYQLRKPVIAAMNGTAVGAGINLAMQCDVRICAEDAKVGFPFAARGIVAELMGHWFAPRIMGVEKTLELFMSGRIFSGRQAAEWGLVSRALPKEEVLPAAVALAREMIETSAPVALACIKRMVWESLETGLTTSGRREKHLINILREMPDTTEGVRSFFEKRPARWSGSVARDTPAWPVHIA